MQLISDVFFFAKSHYRRDKYDVIDLSTSAKNCSNLNSTVEFSGFGAGYGGTGGLIANEFIAICNFKECQVIGNGEQISILMIEERMLVAILFQQNYSQDIK